jgi:hypothetical protein
MPGIIAAMRSPCRCIHCISLALIGGERWQSADDWAAFRVCGDRLQTVFVWRCQRFQELLGHRAGWQKSSARSSLLPVQ